MKIVAGLSIISISIKIMRFVGLSLMLFLFTICFITIANGTLEQLNFREFTIMALAFVGRNFSDNLGVNCSGCVGVENYNPYYE